MASDIFDVIPEGYEILRAIGTSGPAKEYLSRHKADNVPVRLRIFNLGQTSEVTTRRHLREYLRCDIAFMEELELAGVMRVFDYSDAKNVIWIATQPAEVDKLSERFEFLKSQSFEFRQELVNQFLTVLQRIHNGRVVHRNLSSEAVFLSAESMIYIGDFGLAAHVSDQHTVRQDTISVVTVGYMPPELRNADTFACDVSCDIFSAGLLAFEILFAAPLPKDRPSEIHQILSDRLKEGVEKEIISSATVATILKATDLLPQRRWLTIENFSKAFEKSLKDRTSCSSMSAENAPTIAVAESAASEETADIGVTADMTEGAAEAVKPVSDTAAEVTPLDSSHEVWNNRYEILEKIGEGGQAIVYKAYDHLTNEEIAIKTIWSHHRDDKSAINRLKQGAMIARSLTHPYIIKTYSVEQRVDSDSSGKYVFICMELIKSKLELGDVMEARRALGQKIRLSEALHIIRQLLVALKYAHEHTIHRDIKPGNIMLVPHNDQIGADSSDLTKFDIRLIDFGIAKVLSQKHIDVTGKGFRSAHYGAPELGDTQTTVDARADIYSAGVIMYQMLTMNLPRKGSPPVNKVNKEVPASLAKVIDKAINADRAKRLKTVSEFIKEIDIAVSKFHWVRQAAKIAAVAVFVVCLGIAVKYLVPQADELPVQQSIAALKNRISEKEIAVFDDGSVVKYSDIEGFSSYDTFRQKALDGLETLEDAGINKFKRSFSSWSEQENIWADIEPAVGKVESIARDMRQYNVRKNLPIVRHLIGLPPSSAIISGAKEQAEQAQVRFAARPLKFNNLDFCANAYDISAEVFTNIETLAGGSDTPQTAEHINQKLRSVQDLRDNFLATRISINTIEQLGDYDFPVLSEKTFGKADSYYQRFALVSAEKYFNLLNQICGTIAYVRDEIDFKRSDMGLISSRLMDLCYNNIETFENYPDWKEKLEQVYKRKRIFGRYMLIHTLLSKNPDDVPADVYDLAVSAKKQYEEKNLDSADAQLLEAAEKYEKFLRSNLSDLRKDCDSLLTFPFVSVENIRKCRDGLMQLSESANKPGWLREDFIDKYALYLKEITSEKKMVRERLTSQAIELRRKITDLKNTIRQKDFFWNSQRIKKYISVAQQYDADAIGDSIEKWHYVDNLSSLSPIINQMESVNSSLKQMLERKGQLDQLANDIDTGITFCGKFEGISSQEKEKYKQLGVELQNLRARLITQQNNTSLIDQTDKIFAAEHGNIQSAFSEIRAKLPYHRIRVTELINKIHSLEKEAEYINESRTLWADILGGLNISQVKLDLADMRTYLEGIKQQVDNWSADSFNRQLRDKCKVLDDAVDEQNRAAQAIISAVGGEKSKLIEGIESFEKKVNEILNDENIAVLDGIAANSKQPALLEFRQLPVLLKDTKRKLAKIVLDDVAASVVIMAENVSADFEVDEWFTKFNAREEQLNNQISTIRNIEGTVPLFQETRQMLTLQSSMETNYYTGLKDYTISLIDYSGVSNQIGALETDTDIVEMCNFLGRMGDSTVPSVEKLRSLLVSISEDLTSLKSTAINTLSEIRNFNKKREQILGRLTTLQQEAAKLDRTNLENSCRQSIVPAVDKIKKLIGVDNQTETLNNLTSSLWTFLPRHKDWSQWIGFLELYHITISGEDILLNSFGEFRLANEKGDNLKLIEIASDPTKIFYTDAGNAANFGWPVYISHQKDPTVLLVFIPVAVSGDKKAFYMTVREISNAQYRLFLEKSGAKPTIKLAGWAYFGDQKGELLIGQAQGQYPPSRITWDKSRSEFVVDEEFKYAPVTWITFHGAEAYAQWLNAQLPTTSQYAYAARAGSAARYPWGDVLSDISSYGHVRSGAWQQAARQYNGKRDDPVKIAYPPVGAIKDFVKGKAIDPDRIVHSGSDISSVWPCFTKNKSNAWGLYDMIGNAWELCLDDTDAAPVICGGSSLSPPEYIGPESKCRFESQACDVGFRIIVVLK